MTMFIGIIAGALMTELSTNFLLSRALVNRVANQATVNSALEMALDQLQNTAIANGCPGAIPATPLPPPVTLNSRTATVSYASCWPTVDVRSPRFTPIAAAASFNVDGSHTVLSSGQDLYMVGSGTTVYQYAFGLSAPNWSRNLGSTITGPSLSMPDPADSPPDPADISNLIPIAGGGSSGCTANACVELVAEHNGTPDYSCHMATNSAVTSRPAAGVTFPKIAFFGDGGGTLYAYNASESGSCALQTSKATGYAAIVAGPIVFPNGTQDELFIVAATGSTSKLLRYTYRQGSPPSLTLSDTLSLPFANPVGIALEKTSVPARVAVTFSGGGVAIANIDASYEPSLGPRVGVGGGIARAPYWCSCPAGPQIGVASQNGALYVLDASLNPVGSYVGGPGIRTTPASDGVGEWFFGADDGYLYEVQQVPGQSGLVLVERYGGGLGQVSSSPQVAACTAGICIYLGSANNAYIVSLDARDATLTACLSTSPPACSGDNPRLWAQVEVGAAGSPRTVHVQGWSYYSP